LRKKKRRLESLYVVTFGIRAAVVPAVARFEMEGVLQRNCLSEDAVDSLPEGTTMSTALFTAEDADDVASVAQYAPVLSLVHRACLKGINA